MLVGLLPPLRLPLLLESSEYVLALSVPMAMGLPWAFWPLPCSLGCMPSFMEKFWHLQYACMAASSRASFSLSNGSL